MTNFDSLEHCARALEACRYELYVIGWLLSFLVIAVCLLTAATAMKRK